jgi:hypothetical protein
MNTPALGGSGGPCVSVARSRSAKRLTLDKAAANAGLHSVDDELLALIERADARISIACQRLIKPDGVTIGYFTSGLVMRCARHAWSQAGIALRSVSSVLQSLPIEQVEPGDGRRLDVVRGEAELGSRCADWMDAGAVEVKVARIVINGWTGPPPAREQHHGQVGATFYQLVIVAPTS